MKKVIIMLMIACFFTIIFAEDYLTIYNNNQGMYKTEIELNLEKGLQFYSLENIPTGIITESVIFLPKDKKLRLFVQNFEYDLANTQKMLQKYINQNVTVFTENGTFTGVLMFYDYQSYGLLDDTTKELRIINAQKVDTVYLNQMPDNFYTKPTLRWQLYADSKTSYKADLSYLTNGVEWRATYNAVLNKKDFTLNSWVTINNRSGKDFRDVNLKLIAGDVRTHQNLQSRYKADNYPMVQYSAGVMEDMAPTFSEREFSDFRIYTLDKKADVDNNQEKQLSLYDLKTVKFNRKYEYIVGTTSTDIIISFKNSKADGLGEPLPKGNINFYEIDEEDGTNQFVGVATLSNTSLNQDVNLKIGTAFDVIGKTTTVSASNQNRVNEAEYEVVLTNNKKENIEVEVIRQLSNVNTEILNSSISYEKKDARTVTFLVKLNAGQERKFTFKERTTY